MPDRSHHVRADAIGIFVGAFAAAGATRIHVVASSVCAVVHERRGACFAEWGSRGSIDTPAPVMVHLVRITDRQCRWAHVWVLQVWRGIASLTTADVGVVVVERALNRSCLRVAGPPPQLQSEQQPDQRRTHAAGFLASAVNQPRAAGTHWSLRPELTAAE